MDVGVAGRVKRTGRDKHKKSIEWVSENIIQVNLGSVSLKFLASIEQFKSMYGTAYKLAINQICS